MQKEDYFKGLEKLIDSAKYVMECSKQSLTAEEFLLIADSYLDNFDNWKNDVEKSNPLEGSNLSEDEKAQYKEKIRELLDFHQKINVKTDSFKSDVSHLLSDVHSKSKALKKYVDNLPSRVSLTNKKEG